MSALQAGIRDAEKLEARDTVNGHTLCGNCTAGLRRACAEGARVRLCAADRAVMQVKAKFQRSGP